jgi:integrase
MRSARGIGSVYQPTYVDKQTRERKKSAVWWISYYHKGKKCRESSRDDRIDPETSKVVNEGTSHAAAVKLLKKRLGEVAQGRPAGRDVERTTFGELAGMLVADYKANGRRSLERIEGALSHLRAYFEDECRAMDITSDRITAYQASRLDAGAAAATINRELAALKRALKLAEIAGKLAARPHVSMLHEANRRKGFFEAEEFRAVLAELPVTDAEVEAFRARRRNEGLTSAKINHELGMVKLAAADIRPVLEVAYTTGWRIASEILTRQKHHVDLEAGWLRLDPGESKNGEGRMFPLTPELRATLGRQLERTRAIEKETGQIIPWLFHREGRPVGSFRKVWMSACERAGLAGKIPHDFRRTAVRNLERAGVPRSAAMAMVGHRTQSIYSRYAIADETMLKDGAVRLAALHAADAQRPAKVIPLRSTGG